MILKIKVMRIEEKGRLLMLCGAMKELLESVKYKGGYTQLLKIQVKMEDLLVKDAEKDLLSLETKEFYKNQSQK